MRDGGSVQETCTLLMRVGKVSRSRQLDYMLVVSWQSIASNVGPSIAWAMCGNGDQLQNAFEVQTAQGENVSKISGNTCFTQPPLLVASEIQSEVVKCSRAEAVARGEGPMGVDQVGAINGKGRTWEDSKRCDSRMFLL